MAQYPSPNSQLSGYASAYDPAAEGLVPPMGGILNGPVKTVHTSTDKVLTAHEILEEIAKRGMQHPHKLPEAEIQILAAFVLGYNSK